MSFSPVAILHEDGTFIPFREALPFTGPNGASHPPEALTLWTSEDWEAQYPGAKLVSLVDIPPRIWGKRPVQMPQDWWEVGEAGVTVTYELEDWSAVELASAEAALVGERSAAVQRYLDNSVKPRGYENIVTCITYADEPAVPRFQREGAAARAFRSKCWERCYALLAEVKAGTRPQLTDEELIAEMPVLVWPD